VQAMGTTPTNDGPAREIAEPAIERLFEGKADPVEPQACPPPAGATGVSQEDPDA
jgi:hypothetical protein